MKSTFEYADEELDLHYEETIKAITENNFCKVFETARPLLRIFANFFLIPKKWRVVIEGLIIVADNFCENKN